MKQAQAPVWDRSAAEAEAGGDPLPPGPVDVAIVGGGFTGLSTALHAAEAGLSAHVIEAERIGHGGSGRNVGLVNAGVWMPPSAVRRAMGEARGLSFLRRFGDGPRRVFDLIERHQIRCEATREGTIHVAHAPSGLRALEGRYADWAAMGAPVKLLDRKEVGLRTGSGAFHGGLLDHRAGTVNPMGYVRGLARAARAAGATVTTGVRATGLVPEAGRWRVDTSEGTVNARAVVLGTNAYTDDLWPGLKHDHTVIRYVQFATEPLGPEAAHILPGRQGVWDTAPVMTSLRRDAEGRLMIGSMGALIGTVERGLTRRWAEARIRRLFPELGPVRFEAAWDGEIAMTPDHLPRIHRLADGLYAPTGYNGRGITTGTLFGAAIAELLTGADPNTLPLPLSVPRPVAGAPVMRRLYAAAFAANQVWQSLR